MNLRHRINRLVQRRGGRHWVEPLGADKDGLAWEAHVYQHADGQQSALVVPAAVDAATWTALAQAQQARLLAQRDR